MAIHLVRKLEKFTRLSADDRRALEKAAAASSRTLGPREDILREGDRCSHIRVILNGWAYRYKHLEDGRRQILSFLIPGDTCDLGMLITRRMDHSVGTLTPVLLLEMPADSFPQAADLSSRLGRALWWNWLVGEAITREWVTSLGRRNAVERLAHLFCELLVRLRAVGLTNGDSYELPVTQEQLGDATGISTVHVNRTLQEMRDLHLIALKGRTLAIPDPEALQVVAMFSDFYLHLDREGSEFDAT
jgi:CRP-like cAMP-binding protein